MKHVKPQHDWSEMWWNGFRCKTCQTSKESWDDYDFSCPPTNAELNAAFPLSVDNRSILDRIMNYLGWERM